MAITIASIVAEVFSELLDTEVYSWWVKKLQSGINGQELSSLMESVFPLTRYYLFLLHFRNNANRCCLADIFRKCHFKDCWLQF
jgi:hypothetical protein